MENRIVVVEFERDGKNENEVSLAIEEQHETSL